MGIGVLLLIIAIILLVLKAIGVQLGRVDFGWAGLAFLALGHLVH